MREGAPPVSKLLARGQHLARVPRSAPLARVHDACARGAVSGGGHRAARSGGCRAGLRLFYKPLHDGEERRVVQALNLVSLQSSAGPVCFQRRHRRPPGDRKGPVRRREKDNTERGRVGKQSAERKDTLTQPFCSIYTSLPGRVSQAARRRQTRACVPPRLQRRRAAHALQRALDGLGQLNLLSDIGILVEEQVHVHVHVGRRDAPGQSADNLGAVPRLGPCVV